MQQVCENVNVDWTIKETVRAKLRVMVRRILKRYSYPPGQCEEATRTMLKQAGVLCAEWAAILQELSQSSNPGGTSPCQPLRGRFGRCAGHRFSTKAFATQDGYS